MKKWKYWSCLFLAVFLTAALLFVPDCYYGLRQRKEKAVLKQLSLSDVSASISATEMLCAYLKEFGGEIVYGEYPVEKQLSKADAQKFVDKLTGEMFAPDNRAFTIFNRYVEDASYKAFVERFTLQVGEQAVRYDLAFLSFGDLEIVYEMNSGVIYRYVLWSVSKLSEQDRTILDDTYESARAYYKQYGCYVNKKEFVNAFDEDYLSIQPSLAEQEDYEEDDMAERVQSEIDTK